jgi:hypothetical protein
MARSAEGEGDRAAAQHVVPQHVVPQQVAPQQAAPAGPITLPLAADTRKPLPRSGRGLRHLTWVNADTPR